MDYKYDYWHCIAYQRMCVEYFEKVQERLLKHFGQMDFENAELQKQMYGIVCEMIQSIENKKYDITSASFLTYTIDE